MRRGISRRQFLGEMTALVSGLALAPLAAGCAPKPAAAPTKAAAKPATEPTQPPQKTEQTIVLRVQMEGGALGAQMGELCQRFSDDNPGIEVQIEELPWADLVMKTKLGAATGDLPDSLFAHTTWHWLGCYKGWYRAIDDLLDAGYVDDYDDFYEVGVENQQFEGRTYGLLDSCVVGPSTYITWNRNLFLEKGLEPPKPGMDIWDLHELAIKVTDPDNGIFGIEMVLHTPARLEVLARCWGKPEYGYQGDTSTWMTSPDFKRYNLIDNPGAQEIFTNWYTPLLEARAQPKPEDKVQGGLFVAGKCAIYQGHHGHPQRMKSSVGDKWEYHSQDAMYLPPGPDGRVGSSWHCHLRCLSALTEHPEETMRLNASLTSSEAQMIALTLTGNRGARKSVYSDPKWQEDFPHYMMHHDILMAKSVEPLGIPWNLRLDEFDDTYNQLSAPLITGTASWAEQGPILQSEIQRIFDLDRP